MDLEEWEFLPRNDGLIDLDEDGVRNITHSEKRSSDSEKAMDMDYFIYPSQDPQRSNTVPSQLVQVPFSWEPIFGEKGMEEADPNKETSKPPTDATIGSSVDRKNSDQGTVSLSSQVSFKKLKENEFADMKLDSPRANSNTSPRMRGDLPQIGASSFAIHESFGTKIGTPKKRDDYLKSCEGNWEERNEKLNLWKLSLSGVGAICSFGVVAAATVCIIFFGSSQKNKTLDKNKNRIRFQIYTDAKILPHATKLSGAVSAASEVSVHKAHISFGGCYNGI